MPQLACPNFRISINFKKIPTCVRQSLFLTAAEGCSLAPIRAKLRFAPVRPPRAKLRFAPVASLRLATVQFAKQIAALASPMLYLRSKYFVFAAQIRQIARNLTERSAAVRRSEADEGALRARNNGL